jgi:hypothetical protein
MSTINFQKTYSLGNLYESAKSRSVQFLSKYLDYPDLYTFNDLERSITFSSERLIPAVSMNRIPVMLLFSNPHPYSVYQGMFLSPNTKSRENLIWSVLKDAGWINISGQKSTPEEHAKIFLNCEYEGPFDLIFNCYYTFPTFFPEDIAKIFGKEYFKQNIVSESLAEFREIIGKTSAKAVVTFNKGVYNLIAQEPIEKPLERMIGGELIYSQINGFDREIPIYLTFPTGWRYHKEYQQLRRSSLERIKNSILMTMNQ